MGNTGARAYVIVIPVHKTKNSTFCVSINLPFEIQYGLFNSFYLTQSVAVGLCNENELAMSDGSWEDAKEAMEAVGAQVMMPNSIERQ